MWVCPGNSLVSGCVAYKQLQIPTHCPADGGLQSTYYKVLPAVLPLSPDTLISTRGPGRANHFYLMWCNICLQATPTWGVGWDGGKATGGVGRGYWRGLTRPGPGQVAPTTRVNSPPAPGHQRPADDDVPGRHTGALEPTLEN